nr:MAG TPA: hypothetical protein [Bacteriophage sp.]
MKNGQKDNAKRGITIDNKKDVDSARRHSHNALNENQSGGNEYE